MTKSLTPHKDKTLFTPGPLTTSSSVKEAMLTDCSSRGVFFIDLIKNIRQELLSLSDVQSSNYTAILMQGSGTFGLESVITSTIAEEGHLLIIINGVYGRRAHKIAQTLKIENSVLEYNDDQVPDLEQIEYILKETPEITDVMVVHSETTAGILNPVNKIGKLVNKYQKNFIVDAVSSFGAVPIDIENWHIDFLVSSSNKCIEGVPGFSFVIAKKEALEKTAGRSRSLSLDLYSQWKGLEDNGQFRFTPPTHTLIAFNQALKELNQEGGIEQRMKRYQNNSKILIAAMKRLGFKPVLPSETQGWIITSFYYPDDPNFDFDILYQKLSELDFIIYPGSMSNLQCFRIGSIGRIFEQDIVKLVWAIEHSCQEMGLDLS